VSSPLYTRGASFTDFTSRIFEFALLPDVSIKYASLRGLWLWTMLSGPHRLSGLLSQADPQLVQTAFAEWISRRSELAAEGYVSPVKPSGGHLDALKKAIQVRASVRITWPTLTRHGTGLHRARPRQLRRRTHPLRL
jgi:hypothetical protein